MSPPTSLLRNNYKNNYAQMKKLVKNVRSTDERYRKKRILEFRSKLWTIYTVELLKIYAIDPHAHYTLVN